MSQTRSVPSSIFDHVLWRIQDVEGTWSRAEIPLGECVLLFTSMDAAHAFLDCCEELSRADLRPVIFSRSRKEFGRSAREANRLGLIGALIDPCPDGDEAPFLAFARTRHRAA